MGDVHTVAVLVGIGRRLHPRLVRLMIGAYNPPTISDLVVPCPNCETRMERVDPASNGGRKYKCVWDCENDTNMTKAIQEISKGSTPGALRRWTVPGSKLMQYTVTQYAMTIDQPTWRCSCPAWTRHMPRKDCKHISRVKAEMNVSYTYDEKKVATSYSFSYGSSATPGIKLKNIQSPGLPKPKTVTVVIPVHVPKTEGRKFR